MFFFKHFFYLQRIHGINESLVQLMKGHYANSPATARQIVANYAYAQMQDAVKSLGIYSEVGRFFFGQSFLNILSSYTHAFYDFLMTLNMISSEFKCKTSSPIYIIQVDRFILET